MDDDKLKQMFDEQDDNNNGELSKAAFGKAVTELLKSMKEEEQEGEDGDE